MIANPGPLAPSRGLPRDWTLPAALPALGFGIAVALAAGLVADHAPWRDELQAFIIARSSGSVGELLHNLRNEGHPALWYLVLFGATRLDPSIYALAAVQIVVALALQGLLWFRSPFDLRLKGLLSVGYFVLIEYGVMARSYGLGAVLALGAVSVRGAWAPWVLLALLANVSFHCLALSGVLALAFVFIERRPWAGAPIWLLGCVVALVTLWPAADTVPAVPLDPDPLRRLAWALQRGAAAVLPIDPTSAPVSWDRVPPGPIAAFAGAGVVLLIRVSVASAGARLLAVGFYLFVLASGALLYPVQNRHVGLVFVCVLALVWMEADRGVAVRRVFLGWAGALAVCGLWAGAWATALPLSASRELARWVERAGLAGETWVAYPSPLGGGLSAYLGVTPFDLTKGCREPFVRWNRDVRARLDAAELSRRLAEASRRAGGPIHIVTEFDLVASLPGLDLVELRRFENAAEDRAIVYRLNRAGRAGSLPDCPG